MNILLLPANVIFMKRLSISAAASLSSELVIFISLPFTSALCAAVNSKKLNGHNTHGGDIMPDNTDDDVKIYIPKDTSKKTAEDQSLPLHSEQRP